MDYSKYHFNYFDVIKRHERIINRPKDWEIKVLAIIMLMVTFIYTFANFGFCSDVEEVSFDSVSNLNISDQSNFFQTQSGTNVGYFEIESGYVYYIQNNSQYERRLAVSNDIPTANGTYTFLTRLKSGQTYSYIGNNQYLYFDFTPDVSVTITRERINGYEGAVGDLVDNVGVNQIWNVFNNGISFVGVVVLVAFGLFLVVLAIKKVSKGKSEF